MKRIKIWKWLFFILLTLNLAVVLLVVSPIFMSSSSNLTTKVAKVTAGEKICQLSASRDELNGLINSYLKEQGANGLAYVFYLTDSNAVLQMNYKVLLQTIPVDIYFQPVKRSDGSVLLKVQSVSAGSLNLPVTATLDYAKTMKLPDFVKIDSKNAAVTLDLNQLVVAGNYYFKAESIDIAGGNYVFDLYKK